MERTRWKMFIVCMLGCLGQTLCNPMDPSLSGSFCLWGFSRQEYWSGLPCPSPRDLPNPGIEPTSIMSPAVAGGFFTISITWEDVHYHIICHGERGAQPKCPVIGDCVYHGTTILYLPCQYYIMAIIKQLLYSRVIKQTWINPGQRKPKDMGDEVMQNTVFSKDIW